MKPPLPKENLKSSRCHSETSIYKEDKQLIQKNPAL